MSEIIRPQFTYSPEGILEIKTGIRDGIGEHWDSISIKQVLDRRSKGLENVADQPGVQSDVQDGDIQISVDVAERFGKSFIEKDESDIQDFLLNVSSITPNYAADSVDRVVLMNDFAKEGESVGVSQHFQKWLNNEGISEDTAKESLLAAALPYGEDFVEGTKKYFRYYKETDLERAYGFGTSVCNEVSDVKIYKYTPLTDNKTRVNFGASKWAGVTISSFGDGNPSWNARDAAGRAAFVFPQNLNLYHLDARNVESSIQFMSLFFGMGALAYHAAKYSDDKDLLDSVTWEQRERIFPT